jgi:hypothetical protein
MVAIQFNENGEAIAWTTMHVKITQIFLDFHEKK